MKLKVIKDGVIKVNEKNQFQADKICSVVINQKLNRYVLVSFRMILKFLKIQIYLRWETQC